MAAAPGSQASSATSERSAGANLRVASPECGGLVMWRSCGVPSSQLAQGRKQSLVAVHQPAPKVGVQERVMLFKTPDCAPMAAGDSHTAPDRGPMTDDGLRRGEPTCRLRLRSDVEVQIGLAKRVRRRQMLRCIASGADRCSKRRSSTTCNRTMLTCFPLGHGIWSSRRQASKDRAAG
jgi:hypothetical protein